EPTYSSVYQHATSIKTSAIRLPLGKDYRQNIPAMIKAANDHAAEIGLVYLCNPNNPTGLIVTKDEVKQLLDGLPKGMPVLIDEAYHHFVDDPNYATSVPADDDAHEGVGRHGGGDGPVHEGLQGDLPGQDPDDGRRLRDLQFAMEFGGRRSRSDRRPLFMQASHPLP